MTLTSIELARSAFAQAAIATMATQLGAYFRLARHPEVQFGDLIQALERGPVIADDASNRLHLRLKLPPDNAPSVSREFWYKLLSERNIDPTSPFCEPRALDAPAQPLTAV